MHNVLFSANDHLPLLGGGSGVVGAGVVGASVVGAGVVGAGVVGAAVLVLGAVVEVIGGGGGGLVEGFLGGGVVSIGVGSGVEAAFKVRVDVDLSSGFEPTFVLEDIDKFGSFISTVDFICSFKPVGLELVAVLRSAVKITFMIIFVIQGNPETLSESRVNRSFRQSFKKIESKNKPILHSPFLKPRYVLTVFSNFKNMQAISNIR